MSCRTIDAEDEIEAAALEQARAMARWRMALIVLLVWPFHSARATDDDPRPPNADQAEARVRRLDFMKGWLARFTVQTDADPPLKLTLADEPALRWTNPARGVDGDGATFFWLRGGRPVAVATVSIRSEGKVFREFALLGDEPLVTRRGDRTVWTPRKNAYPFGPLDDAPAPARSPALRLAQMRTLVRRFRVSPIKGNPVEARLLSRPLVRYEDPRSGVLDGAAFSFAEGTDPEALILLESRRDDVHPDGRWFYSIARMTSSPLEVRLDDHVVWSCPGYWISPRSPDDAYSEAYLGVYEDEKR